MQPATAQASKAKQTKAATADKQPAQPAQRQPATQATATARSQEPSSHEPADNTQRQWDAYEQQLQAYCTQVAPTSVRQCMHGELARQDTEQARQRAKKYTAPRASR